MVRNDELVQVAKKAADAWRNTDAYHQAAQIIDMLVEELEGDTLTQPNEPLTLEVFTISQLCQMLGEKVEVIRMSEMCQAEWATVRSFGDCKTDSGCLCCRELYGNTWISYRRPAEGEEETHGNGTCLL